MKKIRIRKLQSFNFGIETWIYIAVALCLGFLITKINRYFFPDWFSLLDKSTMVSILSAVSSGMITLTGIVFSLVFVLLQFGSATFSPRLSRIFEHSYVLRHSLGIFTGTFLYSLMAMRTVSIEKNQMVSGLLVWVLFL